MIEKLKDYFYFTRNEKNGILILVLILLVMVAFPYLYDIFSPSNQKINSEFKQEIEEFTQSLQVTEDPDFKSRLDQYIIERYDSIELFFFNPNNTSRENYIKLGFTEKQVNTIFNYLQKGGKFFTKDDFRKIYGIRYQQYQIVKPYILLPESNKSDYASSENKNLQLSSNEPEVFVFDPNTVTDQELTKLGFTETNIKTIRNYQAKIGRFKTKEDFKRIYGISEEKFNQLEPYIFINQPVIEKEEVFHVELNSANIDELVKIKGIGKYSAEAIIKYREKLGGYVSVDQILEVKSISQEMYDLFKTHINVASSKIKTININFAEVDELSAHPYINYQQAKEIVKFRSTNGPYRNKKQLLENKILLEQSYKKIEPYLSL